MYNTWQHQREMRSDQDTHTHTKKKGLKKKCIWGRSETGMNEEINVYHLKHTWHTCWFSSLQIPLLVCPHILSPTTFNTDSNNYMTSFRAFVGTPFITNFFFHDSHYPPKRTLACSALTSGDGALDFISYAARTWMNKTINKILMRTLLENETVEECQQYSVSI